MTHRNEFEGLKAPDPLLIRELGGDPAYECHWCGENTGPDSHVCPYDVCGPRGKKKDGDSKA